MKGGITAGRELVEFLRERAKLEEDNCKAQAKLANKLSPACAGSTCGTFTPLLMAFKVTSDKLSGIHNQWSCKLNDLLREVVKYNDEQAKKHKQIKEDESPTLEAVKSIQETTLLLQKAKDIYKQKCAEMEKLRRDNASSKDLEKAEAKFRKAQDDYKGLVDKYCTVRDDFERKMTLAAKHFQEVENAHLKQMREFVENYCQIVDNNNNMLGRVYQEFQIQLIDLSVENLLEQFTLTKHTGLEKPGKLSKYQLLTVLFLTLIVQFMFNFAVGDLRKLHEYCMLIVQCSFFVLDFMNDILYFLGSVEFDEEKISLTSATGPASDISAGSSNSSELKNISSSGATALPSTSSLAASGASTSGGASAGNNSSGNRKNSIGNRLGLQVASSMTSLIRSAELGGSVRNGSMKSSGGKANSRSLLNLFSINSNTVPCRQGKTNT